MPNASADKLLRRELAKIRAANRGKPSGGASALPYSPMLLDVARGKLAFFLGSGTLLGRLPLADGFYAKLAKQLSMQRGQMDDARLAQHFVDLNKPQVLYALIDKMLRRVPRPTAINWFIATLRSRLQAKGYGCKPLMIFTTNYSDWMEAALSHAGEHYHLFSYCADDESRFFLFIAIPMER